MYRGKPFLLHGFALKNSFETDFSRFFKPPMFRWGSRLEEPMSRPDGESENGEAERHKSR